MLHLVLEDNEIRIEPEFRLYEEAILNVFELILGSATTVPRVDTLLLHDQVRRKMCEWQTHDSLKPQVKFAVRYPCSELNVMVNLCFIFGYRDITYSTYSKRLTLIDCGRVLVLLFFPLQNCNFSITVH